MSLDDALEVPAPKSARSTIATASPARAASAAIPAPMIPPPTTRRSKRRPASSATARSRRARSTAGSSRPGGPGRQRRQHRPLRTLVGARPRPREAAVEVGVVRVVGGDAEAALAALQHLVPVDRRESAGDLELAPGVVDLEPGDVVAERQPTNGRPRPVWMREVRDAGVLTNPAGGGGEIGTAADEL